MPHCSPSSARVLRSNEHVVVAQDVADRRVPLTEQDERYIFVVPQRGRGESFDGEASQA